MNNLLKKLKNIPSIFRKNFKDGIMLPVTFDHGYKVKVSWSEFKRGFLKKRWQFMLFTYAMIITVGFGYLLHDKINTQAATYGFSQSTWSEASTTVIALHDNDQDLYYKYYSKDNNIDLTNTSEIKLTNPNTFISEASSSDFDTGEKMGTEFVSVDTTNNELKINTGYDATGICGNFIVFPSDPPSTMTWATAVSHCNSLCTNCRAPSSIENVCMCSHKEDFGNNFAGGWYWTSEDYNGALVFARIFGTCTGNSTAPTNPANIRCVRDF